ncbi:MAG: efflux RND transporter periplasmic adaptor subunit [Xanthomonadales bacterium]|nr:efflux RND transporter periplasmic adaptor subunit [Xanthomonadales bacterium]HQW77460.1 efflux RND transporter periplasmic adaptor subunit [Dokdonella sp.]MBK7013808.1 efflux RND transporter periplasmic adaptor subunit [Xanthomonadales bacterium]MBK7209448.1 efflux RND transporter periplasmic adaptor subunit [Xanthomonadales bacterium]MBL0223342.1 efflux RND transporter periplasmic adaptor subunit [Xanthomonadales bacterium]
MPASSKHWKRWFVLAVLALVLLAAWGVARMRGPVLPGYEVQAGPLVQDVVATGRVANPSRVQIGAEITGLVLERRVIEGDRVAPGDVLVLLRAQELEARRDQARAALAAIREADLPEAQARLRQTRAQLSQAERELARRKELVERQLLARETVEQAAQAVVTVRATAEQARLAVDALAGGAREAQAREALAAAEAALAHAKIRATVAGTVLSRSVEPGDTVRPGDVLLVIAADAPGEILVPVDEKNLSRLAVGQPATCIADAYPGRPFAATVFHIAPGVDPSRGTVDVRLRLDPAADFVRQDMTVTATIRTAQRDRALIVPADALLDARDGSDQATVLAVRDGRVRRTPVTLGLRGLLMVEVTAGLSAGEHILAAAAIDAEAVPNEGDRVRIDSQALPTADSATRRELPVRFD